MSFYATRVKQYPLEALGSAVLLGLFVRALETRRWRTVGVVGAILVATLHSLVARTASGSSPLPTLASA